MLFQSTRPVWGATGIRVDTYTVADDFNPRAPYGARLRQLLRGHQTNQFQSTRPVWGATAARRRRDPARRISIHAPRMGRDSSVSQPSTPTQNFNPRAPYGARLGKICFHEHLLLISIHAPRMGRDVWMGRGAEADIVISIHAPRMGRDKRDVQLFLKRLNFNPRAPYGARRHRVRWYNDGY